MSLAPSVCPACGGENQCALSRGASAAECWCMQAILRMDLPPRSATPNAPCFCPACGTRKEKAPVVAGASS